MQKLFFSLTLIIILIIGSVYGVLFTSYGNSLISSYIESKVNNEQEKIKLKVNNFKLTTKSVNFDAVINDDSFIKISGDLSLFRKSADLKYDIKIDDLSTLKNLLNQELKGTLYTNGIFKGDERQAIFEGFTNLASSQTKYHIDLTRFNISAIQLDLKDAKIEELLSFFNKPEYIKGHLNIDANIRNININNLDGLLEMSISKGTLNNDVINKEFNQTLSSTINFHSNINASSLSNKIEIKSELLTSIADIFLDKTVMDLNNKTFFSDYKINMKNLNRLEGVLGRKLNGEFSNSGKIKFENSLIFVDGKSNVFDSSTSYKFELKDFIARNIDFEIENAKIEKILHFLDEPIYLIGDLAVKGKIKDSSLDKLDGLVVSKISDAKIINEVVNAVFKQELKSTIIFNSLINTTLLPNQAISKIDFLSSIANININKAVYNFKEKSFNSDYLLNISDLERIKEYTKTPLRGKIALSGDIENKNSILNVKGNSSVIGGILDFNLKNDNLIATLKNANIKELLYMMKKPEIFDSKANLKLDYDLLLKRGNLDGTLLNGHFLANDFSILINQLSKFDLTKEVYEKTKLNGQINDKLLISNLNMQSVNSKIDMKDGIFDFEQNKMDVKLDTQIKDSNFLIKLNGDMSKPNISLDTKELLKKEMEKNGDKIEEKLDKVLDEKIKDEKTKELIKNLKLIF